MQLKKNLYFESGEMLEQIAQRNCGCGSVQGQVGWGSEQPAVVKGRFGTRWSLRYLSK